MPSRRDGLPLVGMIQVVPRLLNKLINVVCDTDLCLVRAGSVRDVRLVKAFNRSSQEESTGACHLIHPPAAPDTQADRGFLHRTQQARKAQIPALAPANPVRGHRDTVRAQMVEDPRAQVGAGADERDLPAM